MLIRVKVHIEFKFIFYLLSVQSYHDLIQSYRDPVNPTAIKSVESLKRINKKFKKNIDINIEIGNL